MGVFGSLAEKSDKVNIFNLIIGKNSTGNMKIQIVCFLSEGNLHTATKRE